MLLLSVVIIAVTMIWKCSCRRQQKEDPDADGMEMTVKSLSLRGPSLDAGSQRGLPELPPESPFDVTEVSPHSEFFAVSPRSPTAGHIAAMSSGSAISSMAVPAGGSPFPMGHQPNSPSRAEGLDFDVAGMGSTAGMHVEEEPAVPHHLPSSASIESNVSMTLDQDDGRRDSHLVFQKTLKNIFDAEDVNPSPTPQGLPPPVPPPPSQGLPQPMDYQTKGGDESEEEEVIPMAMTKGHFAEQSTEPMHEEMKVNAGHIAAVSSVSSFGAHSPYDAMYGRGGGQTAGFQAKRASWKE